MDTGSSGSSSSDAKLNAPCILILYEGAKQRELGGINGGGGRESGRGSNGIGTTSRTNGRYLEG